MTQGTSPVGRRAAARGRLRKFALWTAVAAAMLAADMPARAQPREAAPPSPSSAPGADRENAVAVDLQRQVNELRSELLDERERRIERQLEANGAALVVLAIVIGGGGVWFCARLRAIAAEARIGATLAGAYEATPEGLLPEPGSYHSPPGERRGPLRLLYAPGPEAGPDTVARANGHARASSVAAPRPPAPSCAPSSDCLPGAAVPAPDADVERREEAIADCTEAIRRDPRKPRMCLERAGLRSELDRHQEAVEDYDRAIRLDPNLAAAYLVSLPIIKLNL